MEEKRENYVFVIKYLRPGNSFKFVVLSCGEIDRFFSTYPIYDICDKHQVCVYGLVTRFLFRINCFLFVWSHHFSVECEKYSWQVHRGKVNRVNCSNNSRGIPPIYFCDRYLLKKLCHSIIYLAAAAQDTKLAERVIAWPFQGCFRQCDLNDPSGVKPSLKA